MLQQQKTPQLTPNYKEILYLEKELLQKRMQKLPK